jgi:hypothetical protein
MKRPISFEDALAEALECCTLGTSADEAAAAFPQFDLLPYLDLAQGMRRLAHLPGPKWFERSLGRLNHRMDPGPRSD